MYYSSGNYEAFARPRKPDGVDRKSAYLVGAGLAGLAAACFLVRDGGMKGSHIHIFEEMGHAGSACGGYLHADRGFVIHGACGMEDHFECLWDLMRSIPSFETKDASVLDEYFWLNKKDPNYSLIRMTERCGQNVPEDGSFGLDDRACQQLLHLYFTKDAELYDKKIEDVLEGDFFNSNFWIYWRMMFAFEKWHSALEAKRCLRRFVHHIGGLQDMGVLKFSKYNLHESLILPMVRYLEEHGVQFFYNIRVTDVIFDVRDGKKMASRLVFRRDGQEETIDLIEDDLVFITNGSCGAGAVLGNDDCAPCRTGSLKEEKDVQNDSEGGDETGWELWMNLASQSRDFGHPEKFRGAPEKTGQVSATVTTLDERIPEYIEKICRRYPFSGKVVTGGFVAVRDSAWFLNWNVNRQPYYKEQPRGQLIVLLQGMVTDRPGDFIRKPMSECTGYEITQEWLYHLGVPEAEIPELARTGAHCVPCMLPYGTACFMPRTAGDRPGVVPEGSVNFAFIGQFADTERDTASTAEYSVRTAMEAVYTLLDIDRGVPEVFHSAYDMRYLLDASSKLLDGRKLSELKLPPEGETAVRQMLEIAEGTTVQELFEKYDLI